jgi:hypothetical protein
MVGENRAFDLLPKEAPFQETDIDLLIPGASKALAQFVRLIERIHGSHHVDDGLCTEPGNGGASIVLKFVRDAPKEGPQARAFLGKTFRPQRIRGCDQDMAERPPCMCRVAHSTSLVIYRSSNARHEVSRTIRFRAIPHQRFVEDQTPIFETFRILDPFARLGF